MFLTNFGPQFQNSTDKTMEPTPKTIEFKKAFSTLIQNDLGKNTPFFNN